MRKVTFAIVGASGYGDYCLSLLDRFVDPETYTMAAIIDRHYETIPRHDQYAAAGVPMYRNLPEFYAAGGQAEVVLISSPIHIHLEQCICAMEHGSHVLCEKPLSATLQEAAKIREVQERTGRMLAVGFQLSFCQPVLDLKRDYLSGKLGKPVHLASYVSWQRFDSYYNSAWKGHIKDASGKYVLDAVLTNATAHFLQNMLFVTGSTIDTSAQPTRLEAEVYNGKPIETFDTVFLRGDLPAGGDFYCAFTHAGDRNVNPIFRYEFENAVVDYVQDSKDAHMIATFKDGTRKDYGAPFAEDQVAEKIRTMLAVVAGEQDTLPSVIETVLPQMRVCNSLFDKVDIHKIPTRHCVPEGEQEEGWFMDGLTDAAYKCYETRKMPSELGYDWAAHTTEWTLDGYEGFTGVKFAKEGE